jgi:hypothetical protein
MPKHEATQRTVKGLEIPVPTRKDWNDTLSKVVKLAREVEDAATQEAEYSADEN